MLVICTHKSLSGFTYGRIYRIAYQVDMKKIGYSWVKIQLTNDKGIIVGEDKMSFITITDWKEYINKNNGSSL